MKIVLSIGVALALLFVGNWYLSAAGGVVAGAWVLRRGWLWGAVVVGTAWAVAVMWNLAVAGDEVSNLFDVMGAFAGVPGWLIPITSIAVGGVLGLVGGLIGSALALLGTPSGEGSSHAPSGT